MDERCETCRFFIPRRVIGDDADWDRCRRFPPVPMQGSYGSWYWAHPVVYPEGWCGEYDERR